MLGLRDMAAEKSAAIKVGEEKRGAKNDGGEFGRKFQLDFAKDCAHSYLILK